MKILILDPHKEMILHMIPVYANSDVRKIEAFIENQKPEHPDIERILVGGGYARFMEPGEKIPVPLRPGKGLMIPGGGQLY